MTVKDFVERLQLVEKESPDTVIKCPYDNYRNDDITVSNILKLLISLTDRYNNYLICFSKPDLGVVYMAAKKDEMDLSEGDDDLCILATFYKYDPKVLTQDDVISPIQYMNAKRMLSAKESEKNRS